MPGRDLLSPLDSPPLLLFAGVALAAGVAAFLRDLPRANRLGMWLLAGGGLLLLGVGFTDVPGATYARLGVVYAFSTLGSALHAAHVATGRAAYGARVG